MSSLKPEYTMRHKVGRIPLVGLAAALVLSVTAPARAEDTPNGVNGERPGATVKVEATVLRLTDTVATLTPGSPAEGELDLAMLRRLVVEPGDLRAVHVVLQAKPLVGGARVLAKGEAADGDVVDLAGLNGAGQVQLSPDDELIIVAWRRHWHWHGAATITGLTLRPVQPDGEAVALPRFAEQPRQETPAGTFRLLSLASRDQFPKIEEQATPQAGEGEGVWATAGSKGTVHRQLEKGVRLESRGRADGDKGYKWAPAITFQPKQQGTFAIEGSLQISSGETLDKNNQNPMSYLVLVRPATAEARKADASSRPSAPLIIRSKSTGAPLTAAGAAPGTDLPLSVDAVIKLLESSDAEAHEIEVALGEGEAERPLQITAEGKGSVTLKRHNKVALHEVPVRSREGQWVVERDGKLWYGDQRLRLWGVNGYPDVERFVALGFNSLRIFQPFSKEMYSESSAKSGDFVSYTKGDDSPWDKVDQRIANLKAAGCFVVLGSMQNNPPFEWVASDGSFVDDGADDYEAWKQALAEMKYNDNYLIRGPMFFDERLKQIKWRHAENLLNHVNQHTDTRYAEEEAIAVYYIFNENGGVKSILEGSFEKWPAYFQEKFKARWNGWLVDRYDSASQLERAWGDGGLDADESLASGTIRPGPALGERANYPEQRSSDFVRFVIEMIDGFHQDFRAHCRSMAPEGVGVNVAPFTFDTQYRPSLAWNYLQSQGDVNSPGMYFWDLQSQLDRPPSAYVMDSHTTRDVATIIYETNHSRPGPYRAEFPLKAAAMANWLDWDGVFWHYWHPGGMTADEEYLASPMKAVNRHHFWDAVHHHNDPVMVSSLTAASQLFLGYHTQPAPDPEIVEVGGDALFGYDHHNGFRQTRQTFDRGSFLSYKPDAEIGVTIDGNAPAEADRVDGAVQMGSDVIWDWPNGRLIIDTPTVKVYAGRFEAPYRFRDGIVLEAVSTPSVAFTLISDDGRPLVGDDASQRVHLTAVRDAMNTGFDFDYSVRGGPMEQAAAVRSSGRAPVQVEPVHFTLTLPQQITGQLRGIDFARREADTSGLDGTNRITYAGPTMWLHVLEVDSRGESVDTTGLVKSQRPGNETNGTGAEQEARSGEGNDSRWLPVPGVRWSDDYHEAHRSLREAMYPFTSISELDPAGAAPQRSIRVFDAELPALWSKTADLEFSFTRDALQQITATFSEPPPFDDAVDGLKELFGEPAEQQVAAQYERSLARWPATKDRPQVLLTESQGVLKLLIQLETGLNPDATERD